MENRAKKRNSIHFKGGSIVYWMSRDQRVNDNWALLYAQQLALKYKEPLIVCFSLSPSFLGATLRQYDFMIKGLKEAEEGLKVCNIPFYLLIGNPKDTLPRFLKNNKAGALICDFDPLRIKRQWKKDVQNRISIPFYQVDAHNIVPYFQASPKQEYGAYTIRNKINGQLDVFLTQFLKLKKQKQKVVFKKTNWQKVFNTLDIDNSVKPVDWILPGEMAAKKMLKQFISKKLKNYDQSRNDPSLNGQSNLSPYLHFGHIAAQRVAYEVKKSKIKDKEKEAFLEELIIRRELADNYCYYNANYDSPEGFPDWANKTLKLHKSDKREHIYTLKQLEKSQTHDDLWNAAQKEMVISGKMHGYMRMYIYARAYQTCVI
jgi:deoxyribodipyrimidine photo-lyase